MRFESSTIAGVVIVRPEIFSDERGWFTEAFNASVFEQNGLPHSFVQDNQSFSRAGVLRGLHYQVGRPQGKLVRVLSGEIYDVAVDLRQNSSTFGQWMGFRMSAERAEMVWIPEGFAHGFLVLSASAQVFYKVTDYYCPQEERILRWDDPSLGIDWPITQSLVISQKDAAGSTLREADLP